MLLVKFDAWLSVMYAVGCWRSNTVRAIGSMSSAVPEATAVEWTCGGPTPCGTARWRGAAARWSRCPLAWMPAEVEFDRSNSSASAGLRTMISGTDSTSSISVIEWRIVM
jgi:hypothetical protein